MNDDELRERLHAMPEPTATIDVDAVVADARRRRRPKVVGAGVAVGAACLAFLAPVVVPGLLGPDPVTSTLQEQGVAEQGDSGAQPAAPAATAPDETQPGAEEAQPTAGEDPAPTYFGDQGAAGNGACFASPSRSVVPGLALAFLAAPEGGAATLLVSNEGSAPIVVRIGNVGVATTEGSTVVGAAFVDIAGTDAANPIALAPGERVAVDVAVATNLVACGTDGRVDGTAVPLVALAIGDGGPIVGSVLGDPSAS